MKMFPAATADILNYTPYSRNCNLGQCKQAYFAAVPTLADVQVFLNLGTVQPSAIDFTIINLCEPFNNETINSETFIIAFNGSYWYAVYKNFSGPAYTRFMIAASVSYTDETTQIYFSEQYQNATDCDSLTKVSVCYPYNWNSEDINGIYIGQPDTTRVISGLSTLFYHHQYWVTSAEVIETSNKITFTANLYKNFNTDLKKLFEFRPTEKYLSGWYKDYLLAVYFRGQFFINDTAALMSDLNFECIDEGSDNWKAYAVITREIKGAFGCADIECPDDSVCVDVDIPDMTFEDAMVSVPYHKTVPIGGSPAFFISDIVKPDWMTITIVGSNIIFGGTPTDTGSGSIGFTVTNVCSNDAREPGDGDIVVDPFEETDTFFDTTTFISSDALHEVEKANLVGVPGATVTVTLTALLNNNGGDIKVNSTPAALGNTWPVLLDGSGNGFLDVEIDGVTNPGTAILGHFAITAVTAGGIGTPATYSITKVFS